MEALCAYGLTPRRSAADLACDSPACLDLIRKIHTACVEEGTEIPFEKADEIAASLERPQDDAWRVRAGIEICFAA